MCLAPRGFVMYAGSRALDWHSRYSMTGCAKAVEEREMKAEDVMSGEMSER